MVVPSKEGRNPNILVVFKHLLETSLAKVLGEVGASIRMGGGPLKEMEMIYTI